MTEEQRKAASNEELSEKLGELERELEILSDEIRRIETELFYRRNPECRPK